MKRGHSQSNRGNTRKPVDPIRHLAESLHKRCRRYLKWHERCREELSKRTVHRSRVQTRRLLSQLGLLKGFVPAKMLKEAGRSLKRHHKLFRDLRDAQVQITLLKELGGEFSGAKAFADWIHKREVRASRKARGAIKRVKTGRLKKQIAAFEKELRRRGKGASAALDGRKLRRALDRTFERVVQSDGCVDAADPRSIHRVRVAFKRYFYRVKALPPGLSGITGQGRREMRKHLSQMGKIQDHEVLLAALAEFEREDEAGDASVRDFREVLLRRRAESIQGYMRDRSALADFRPKP